MMLRSFFRHEGTSTPIATNKYIALLSGSVDGVMVGIATTHFRSRGDKITPNSHLKSADSPTCRSATIMEFVSFTMGL